MNMKRDGTSDFVPSIFLSKYRVSQNIPRSYKKQIPHRHTQCRADRIFNMKRDGTSDFVPSLFLSKYRVSQNIPRSYKKQIPYRHPEHRAERIFPEIHLHHTRRD